jgi:hypothetical protein
VPLIVTARMGHAVCHTMTPVTREQVQAVLDFAAKSAVPPAEPLALHGNHP